MIRAFGWLFFLISVVAFIAAVEVYAWNHPKITTAGAWAITGCVGLTLSLVCAGIQSHFHGDLSD